MHWGAHGRSGGSGIEPIGITEEMMQAGWHHGVNIARVAAALQGRELLARGNVAPSSELVETVFSRLTGKGVIQLSSSLSCQSSLVRT